MYNTKYNLWVKMRDIGMVKYEATDIKNILYL